MQNSYTKEGQLSWWLALLECLWIHKGRVRIPFPSKLKSILIFTQSPPSPPSQGPPSPPAKPAQLKGPRAGPQALDLPRARPVDQSTGSVARPGLGHGPYFFGPGGPAQPVGDP